MRKFNCCYCNERFYAKELPKHIDKKHDDLLPDDYTAYRMAYDIINHKDGHGNCTICKKPTKWNEKRQKYERLCGNPKCAQEVRETYKKRMLRVYNKIHLLDDPNHQEKMLAHRKISGTYKWSDGKEFTYTGQYEKKLMEFLDHTMEYKSSEVLAPGPILEYEYKGKKLHWITDFLLIPNNLIIEVKDGGDNPNKRSMPVTREKTLAKEKMITNMGKYNYLRLTNNDFLQLFQMLAELKANSIEDDDTPLYRIHESVTEDNSFLSLDEAAKIEVQSIEQLVDRAELQFKTTFGSKNKFPYPSFEVIPYRKLTTHPSKQHEIATLYKFVPKDKRVNKEAQDKMQSNCNAIWLELNSIGSRKIRDKEGWAFSAYFINEDRKTDGWILGVKRFAKI